MVNYILIDGMNLAYRSHLSLKSAKGADGRPSGMLFGFIRTLTTLKKRFRQYSFVVVWDNKPTHKYDVLPEYKSGRTKLDSSVFDQVDKIKELLASLNVTQYEVADQEADDVIATLVEGYKKDNSGSIIVYTNDKDMLQLVDGDKVVVLKPKVGTYDEIIYNNEAVIERFGVEPNLLAVFRSFDGDSSDNIKGVSRVRRKRIAEAVTRFKDIDKIYANIDKAGFSSKEYQRMLEFREQVKVNYSIIKLNSSLQHLKKTSGVSDLSVIERIFKEYAIKTLKAQNIIDLFDSSLNIKINDSSSATVIESYSLF